jgi:hypothetical protein
MGHENADNPWVIAYYAALAFVLACSFTYVFANGVFDVGRFVTAVPVVSVVFLVLSVGARVIFRRSRTLAVRPKAYPYWRHDQRIGLVIGVLGLVIGGFNAAVASADMHSYQAAASCQAGFSAALGGDAPCRLEFARITAAYTTGRHMTPTLTLQFKDGSRHRAVVARDLSGHLWRAARRGTALDATAQLFRGKVVELLTSAGVVQTTDYPQHRMMEWMGIGLVTGSIGVASAVAMAFRGLA